MGLFGLFGKSPEQREEEASMRRAEAEDLEIYSGMRVEVTSNDGRIFLAAKLTSLRGDRAQLLPLTEGNLLTRTEEPIPVMIRGFSSRENKAVLMEASVRLSPNKAWQVEHITLVKRGNDRAFFRMDTNVTATITPMIRFGGAGERCKLVNVSVGGVCLGCQARHNIGDKFRLEARLLPVQAPLDLGCQILRILERKHDYFEYGCRFLDLSEADENRILQIIFGLQRKKRQV